MKKHNRFLSEKCFSNAKNGTEKSCMSNYIQKRKHTRIKGKTDEGFLKSKLKASTTKHTQARRGLQELDGFCQDTHQETRQEILADLLNLSQSEDITEDIQELLQGLTDYMLEPQTCNVCTTGKRKDGKQCNSCHGTLRRDGYVFNTYKGYIQQVKDYLRYHGVLRGINEKELKISVKRPEVEMRKALETPILKKIILSANKKQLLYHFLATSACRIREALSLKGTDLEFIDESGKTTKRKNYHRIKVWVRAEYAKSKKERFTFVHREIEEEILERLDTVGKTGLLFGNNSPKVDQVSLQSSLFQDLRQRLADKGIVEMLEKYKTGRAKITLHTFRSWGVSRANRIDYGFGHFIAGHEQYMAIYDRLTEREMLDMWKKVEQSMILFEAIPENEVVTELKNQLEETQKELQELKKQNKDISDAFKDAFDDDDDPPTPSNSKIFSSSFQQSSQ